MVSTVQRSHTFICYSCQHIFQKIEESFFFRENSAIILRQKKRDGITTQPALKQKPKAQETTRRTTKNKDPQKPQGKNPRPKPQARKKTTAASKDQK